MTSRLASVAFIEETDKNFEFITAILSPFLGSGDFVTEKQTLVLFSNETFSGVMNL